ncbi:nuclear exosome regulator NRDE2 [Petromyzon marinus]|uniref:nuclear exosome regulator NRDE2 n=1 Tax=Petromyzon marinus TaxID=7757 RepID=UPI003F6E779C
MDTSSRSSSPLPPRSSPSPPPLPTTVPALFPAFSGAQDADTDASRGLGWLSNQSFRTVDALALNSRSICPRRCSDSSYSSSSEDSQDNDHQRSPFRTSPVRRGPHRSSGGDDDGDEERRKAAGEKRRKEQKKKSSKKKKKRHHRRRDDSHSSSDNDKKNMGRGIASRDKVQSVKSEAVAPVQQRGMWLEDLTDPAASPFYQDSKPDIANLQYMSLYRAHVARYRRKGKSCLGLLTGRQAVEWQTPGSGKKHHRKRQGGGVCDGRYFSPNSVAATAAAMEEEEARTVAPRDPAPPPTPGEFLPLKSAPAGDATERAARELVNPLGVYDDSTTLWLQGKGTEGDGTREDSSGITALSARERRLRDRVEQLNRAVREDPGDVASWLALARLQDELARDASSLLLMIDGGGGSTGGGGTEKSRKVAERAVLEKKLSVLERGVESNPSSMALRLARLELGRDLWESGRLAGEWKKLSFLHPNDPELWRQYLLFAQSQYATFGVSRVNATYGKSLATLSGVVDGTLVSHPLLPNTESAMLDIFLQQCHFLRQAGHTEKAISLFQAMMDFNFYRPDTLAEVTTRGLVEFFETFWDSGEPRFGEPGARGWSAWMRQKERGGWVTLDPPDEGDEVGDDDGETPEEELAASSVPRWRAWLSMERSRERRQWLPWRPDKGKGQTETDCEDPDRQVLYDDVGPSLFTLRTAGLRRQLVDHFLTFLGVPPAPGPAGGGGCHRPPPPSALDDPGLLFAEERAPSLVRDVAAARPGATALGPSPDVEEEQENEWGGATAAVAGTRRWRWSGGAAGEEFVRSVLEQALQLFSGAERAALGLRWLRHQRAKVEAVLGSGDRRRAKALGKRSRRLAKTLLKEPANRNRLELWEEFALLEWRLGERAAARKVLDTAIAVATASAGAAAKTASPPPLSGGPLCSLCLRYAQLELEVKEGGAGAAGEGGQRATHVLVALAASDGAGYSPFDGHPAPPSSVLRARKSFERELDALLATEWSADADSGSSGRARLATVACCAATLQYVTAGVWAADAVFARASAALLARGRDPGTINPEGQAVVAAAAAAATGRGREAPACGGVPAGGVELESLLLERARLLRFHATLVPFPRRPLREALSSAVALVPDSAELLRMYTQNETASGGLHMGELRRALGRLMRTEGSPLPWLFAVYAELRRKRAVDSISGSGRDAVSVAIPESGLSNRLRSLLERALSVPSVARCPLAWRLYLHFLRVQGTTSRSEGILYRAVQACPWAKVLYMDAVRSFPERVQELTDMMTEKELRLRAPPEEVDILMED